MFVRLCQIAVLACLLPSLLSACNVSSTLLPRDGGTHNSRTSAHDAGPHRDSGTAPAAPLSPVDAAVPGVLPSPDYCVQQLGAECDDSSDCPDGRVCCGEVGVATTYASIKCKASCEQANQFQLCHSSDQCKGPGQICRPSFRIHYLVCAPSLGFDPITDEDQPGRVACDRPGAHASCEAGREKCCWTAQLDGTSLLPREEEPYCAPLAEACRCDHKQAAVKPDPSAQDAGR